MTHSYRDEIGIFMERIRFVIFVKCLCEFSLSLELRLDGCNLFLHSKPEIELQSCHVLARSVVDLFVKMPLDEVHAIATFQNITLSFKDKVLLKH